MTLTDNRLALSSRLNDLVKQYDQTNNEWVNSLTKTQYATYFGYHCRLGLLTASQVSSITKSSKLKTVALKASVIQARIVSVNAELDTVLAELERKWAYITA